MKLLLWKCLSHQILAMSYIEGLDATSKLQILGLCGWGATYEMWLTLPILLMLFLTFYTTYKGFDIIYYN